MLWQTRCTQACLQAQDAVQVHPRVRALDDLARPVDGLQAQPMWNAAWLGTAQGED